MNLNDMYAHIEALLDVEEKTPAPVAEREARRAHIQHKLDAFTSEITKLHNRLHRLPELPPVHQ